MSLESDEIQLIHNNQLFLFNSLVASLIVIHFLVQIYSRILGSISHERDHIMIHGNGVNHIEVSITFHASTAVILPPINKKSVNEKSKPKVTRVDIPKPSTPDKINPVGNSFLLTSISASASSVLLYKKV